MKRVRATAWPTNGLPGHFGHYITPVACLALLRITAGYRHYYSQAEPEEGRPLAACISLR